MLTIKKVLNSSVVLVTTEDGSEQIVLQKGVGYGHKAGEQIKLQDDVQFFVPFVPDDKQNMIQLLKEVPVEYPELAREIILHAEKTLDTHLNPHIYLTLTDHLHFAVQRELQNIVVVNRLLWEMKTFYKKEYELGLYALKLVNEKMAIELPEEEAANIAFHLINAQNDDAQADAIRYAKLVGQIVKLVTYFMRYKPDKESIHYSRFIAHLQYFVQRYFTGRMLDSQDDYLYNQMREGYPKAFNCAEKVRTLLLKENDIFITNEETAYLTVHIQRLIMK